MSLRGKTRLLVGLSLVLGCAAGAVSAAPASAGARAVRCQTLWTDHLQGDEAGIYRVTIRGQRIRVMLIGVEVDGQTKIILNPRIWVGRLERGKIVGNYLVDDSGYLSNGRRHRRSMTGVVDPGNRRIRLDYLTAVAHEIPGEDRASGWSTVPQQTILMPRHPYRLEQLGIQ